MINRVQTTQTWFCDTCETRGELLQGIEDRLWEINKKLRAAHQGLSPDCSKVEDEVKTLLPRTNTAEKVARVMRYRDK